MILSKIRFTQLSVLKSLLSLILCSLLILSSNLLSSEPGENERAREGSSFESRRERFEYEREEEEEQEFGEPQSAEGDDPDARNDWFTFQRTYPTDSIPADARRNALEAASKIKLESN